MSELYDAVAAFFMHYGWSFAASADGSALTAEFVGEQGTWTCLGIFDEQQRQFRFYSLCPVIVPEPRRPRLAEYLTRANNGLPIGNFELDYAGGQVRFKTSIDVEEDRLTPALVKQMVLPNLATMQKYLPGIIRLLQEDLLPAMVIAEIEGETTASA